MTFVAVLDPGVGIVRGVTPLDARRGRVVRVLRRDNVGEDAGWDIDSARIYRGPVERDGRRVECDSGVRECEHGRNDDEKPSHVGAKRSDKVLSAIAAEGCPYKGQLGDSQLYVPRPGADSVGDMSP